MNNKENVTYSFVPATDHGTLQKWNQKAAIINDT